MKNNDFKKEKKLIKIFSNDMLLELNNNSHKPSILSLNDFNQIITEFEYHKSKLIIAIRVKNKLAIREYLADCANYLLCIGNLFNVYNQERKNDECFEINKDIEIFKKINIKETSKNQTIHK